MRRTITALLGLSAISLGNLGAHAQQTPTPVEPVAYRMQDSRALRSMDLTSSPYINRDPNCSVWGHRIWPCEQ